VSETARVESGMALQPMRLEHLPEILVLEVELFGSEAWTEDMLRSELTESDGRHYVVAVSVCADEGVAETDHVVGSDQIVGYAGLVAYDYEAHVLTVGVLPAWRRRGLGAALLHNLLDAAGARRVLLEVRADNEAAQRLYVRNGFRPIGRRRGYYQPSGGDAVVMARE